MSTNPSTSNDLNRTIFQPSFLSNACSQLTAPRTFTACGALGTSILLGASLPFAAATAGIALASQKMLAKVIFGGDTLRSAVFLEAEHLSLFAIQGGLPIVTIPPILEVLQTMHSHDAVVALDCLTSVLNFEKQFDYTGFNNAVLVDDFIYHIIQLEPGQKTALSFSVIAPFQGGHVLIGSIEKKEDGQYIIRYHGESLDYHYKKLDPRTGYTIYQNILEIDDVNISNLIPFIQEMTTFSTLRPGHTQEKVYEALRLLNGTILPPNEDPRFWSKPQIGFSCSGYAIKCFLQTVLTKETFKEFEFQFLVMSTGKLKKGIENGWFWDRTQLHKSAYQELREKLVSIGGGDPGPLHKTTSSQISDLALKVQKKFWGFYFAPSVQLTVGREEFQRVGLVHYPDITQWTYGILGQGSSVTSFKEIVDARTKLGDLCRELYWAIPDDHYDANDREEIFKHWREGNYLVALQLIYRNIFPYIDHIPSDPVAVQLSQAIEHLQENELMDAYKKLQSVYHAILPLEGISQDSAIDYGHVMIQMLYLPPSMDSVEQIELRAAASIIFERLTYKADFPSRKYVRLTRHFHETIKAYHQLKIHKIFPASPWRQDIVAMHEWTDLNFLGSDAFKSEPGKELTQLLKNIS